MLPPPILISSIRRSVTDTSAGFGGSRAPPGRALPCLALILTPTPNHPGGYFNFSVPSSRSPRIVAPNAPRSRSWTPEWISLAPPEKPSHCQGAKSRIASGYFTVCDNPVSENSSFSSVLKSSAKIRRFDGESTRTPRSASPYHWRGSPALSAICAWFSPSLRRSTKSLVTGMRFPPFRVLREHYNTSQKKVNRQKQWICKNRTNGL